MIKLFCSECGKKLEVSEEAAGKKGKCPACGAVLTIPEYDPTKARIVDEQPAAVHQTQNVTVQAQSGGFGLGKTALILGCLAFISAWIPFVGMISIPFSGLGFLLGFIGIVIALRRDKQDLGISLAGTLVSGLALVIAISMTVAGGKALQETARPREVGLQETTPAKPNEEKTKVTLKIIDKGFVESSIMEGIYQSQITLSLRFSNTTDKDIRGVEGTLALYDIFGNRIRSTRVSYDQAIPANRSAVWEAGISYNEFIDSNVKLRNTELENLQYEWQVSKIVYSDGTQE